MYKVLTVFFTTHADSVGNAYRINRLKALSRFFELTVITNQNDFLRGLLNTCNIVEIGLDYQGVLKIKDAFKLRVMIKENEFDLLYFFHNDSVIAYFSDKPLLCEIHQSHEIIGVGDSKQKGIRAFIRQKIFVFNAAVIIRGIKKASFNFVVSERLKIFFVKRGVDKSRIAYLPHGVDTESFNSREVVRPAFLSHIPKDHFIMVYTGWVGENRGLGMMLDGLALIKEQTTNIHLVIVGCQNEYINTINQFSKDHNLVDNISVFGRLGYSEIPGIISIADVCLSFLEVNETYSMSPPQKIFEYFAMGKAVIGNKIPTHNDYITDGYNGKIINDLNPVEFANAIMNLIETGDYKTLGNNALDYSKRYDMRNINKELISKIKELIENA